MGYRWLVRIERADGTMTGDWWEYDPTKTEEEQKEEIKKHMAERYPACKIIEIVKSSKHLPWMIERF